MGYIYSIKNKVSGKRYIGQTKNSVKKRVSQHFSNSKRGLITPLYNSMRVYDKGEFLIEIVEECEVSTLNEREKYWIEYYDTYNTGYNCNLGGDGNLGCKLREETKKKMSETWKKKGTSNRKGKTNSKESNIQRTKTLKEGYENGTYKVRNLDCVRGSNNKNYKHGKYCGTRLCNRLILHPCPKRGNVV